MLINAFKIKFLILNRNFGIKFSIYFVFHKYYLRFCSVSFTYLCLWRGRKKTPKYNQVLHKIGWLQGKNWNIHIFHSQQVRRFPPIFSWLVSNVRTDKSTWQSTKLLDRSEVLVQRGGSCVSSVPFSSNLINIQYCSQEGLQTNLVKMELYTNIWTLIEQYSS